MTAQTHTLSRRDALVGITVAGACGLAQTAVAELPKPDIPTNDKWAALVATYRRLVAARDREDRRGAIARANAAFAVKAISYEELIAAEDEYGKRFNTPTWEAAKAVFTYPAPTLAALAEKITIAEDEDALDEPIATTAIIADARRFAEREA